jgi:hypothetical protein
MTMLITLCIINRAVFEKTRDSTMISLPHLSSSNLFLLSKIKSTLKEICSGGMAHINKNVIKKLLALSTKSVPSNFISVDKTV